MSQPLVLVIMGSDSDLPVMGEGTAILKELGIPYEVMIASAHRTPLETQELACGAAKRGIRIIIAGAGGAAHLPGVIAAYTLLPVIGVPIKTASLNGVDSLYSIVQMPAGIPVATMAINGAKNAAIFAAQVLALDDPAVEHKLREFREQLAGAVREKNCNLQSFGVEAYLSNLDMEK